MKLYTASGEAVTLGRELGKGGEGAVYDVVEFEDRVAKIYHTPPDPQKQAKLSFMASTADESLLSYVAWPQATLHARRGNRMVGFLMPKVSGKEPVHMIYSPAHRRQAYPDAAWDFLIYVARNIAASFETVHDHGHVVGDVNQNSFMVGRDSRVVLIDSDSLQIDERGSVHFCEVGVSHFTPPELQALSSFAGFRRTTNHDSFGLALLIFHVLFGGRHPYSGVPLRRGVGEALEDDIRHFRYAYAHDGRLRGLKPPPHSVPLTLLPDATAALFHQAFTEAGAETGRPSAKRWVAALDDLRRRLRKCAVAAIHVYPDHLTACPWCALEKQNVVYFIDLHAKLAPESGSFTLSRVWEKVDSASPPGALRLPLPEHFRVVAAPLPANIPSRLRIVSLLSLTGGMAVALSRFFPAQSIWFYAAGALVFLLFGRRGLSARQAEFRRRAAAMAAASAEYDELAARARLAAGPEGFSAQREALAKQRRQLQELPAAQKHALEGLHATARNDQRRAFLEKFLIETASIPGVNPARKAALRAVGIETAADVNRRAVLQVKGFGEHLTRAVLDWKASCERRFVYNPDGVATPEERQAVLREFVARRAELEKALTEGAAELQRWRQVAAARLAPLRNPLLQAAEKLAQARADAALR